MPSFDIPLGLKDNEIALCPILADAGVSHELRKMDLLERPRAEVVRSEESVDELSVREPQLWVSAYSFDDSCLRLCSQFPNAAVAVGPQCFAEEFQNLGRHSDVRADLPHTRGQLILDSGQSLCNLCVFGISYANHPADFENRPILNTPRQDSVLIGKRFYLVAKDFYGFAVRIELDMAAERTSIDEAVLEHWSARLTGCRRFLENFFLTCGEYPPEVNYQNYVRDLRLYSATNRHLRQNSSSLLSAFYEITGEREPGAARVQLDSETLESKAFFEPARSRYRYGVARQVTDYHSSVDAFKKHLIEWTLLAHGGNRTYAARALGLQRTYLLRLIRQLGVYVPPSERRRQF